MHRLFVHSHTAVQYSSLFLFIVYLGCHLYMRAVNFNDRCYAPSHLPSSGRASDPARSLPRSSGPARFDPLTPLYHFCLFAHPPFLIPSPLTFHVSDVRSVSCPLPRTPFQTPNPEPRSVLLCITSPCSIFVPMLFCPNPCPIPSTLLCSFRYLYVDSFLYVPQSEIDIDCPL